MNKMKDSELLYGVWDHEDFMALVWETELGKIVTCEGKLNIKNDLVIRDAKTQQNIEYIDLKNVLMSILPCKTEPENEGNK